jgi:hypothetical protein
MDPKGLAGFAIVGDGDSILHTKRPVRTKMGFRRLSLWTDDPLMVAWAYQDPDV